MTPQRLKSLNNRLADLRGRNPHGQPIYRWFHSRELTYPIKTTTGYEHLRQIDEDRWVLAMWHPPIPQSQWKAQFPDLGWPSQGVYYVTSFMLRPEVGEPTEAITEDVAGRIKALGHMTFREHCQAIDDTRKRQERERDRIVSDMVDDACAAFDHVPGERGGHVSFGGLDPQTTN